MTQERVYTLVEAAAAAGVSTPTIRRRRDVLEANGARITPKRWEVPHSALIAAGFNPSWTTDQEPQEADTGPVEVVPEESPADELREALDRVRRLESENQILRHMVEKWETVARERLDSLNAERVALHALGLLVPARQIEAHPTPVEPAEPAQEPAERRSWWSRLWL